MEMNIHSHRQRLIAALVIAGALAAPASAQSKRIDGGVASRPAFSFFWETHLEPPTPPLAQSFGTAVLEIGTDVVQRVLLDRPKKTYFGYNVRVEAAPDRTFRMTFQRLTLSPELQRTLGEDHATWKMLPAPAFPAPRTIRSGEVLELPLLVASRGQRVTDYVTAREPESREGFGFRVVEGGRPDFAFAPGTARDFKIEDVELRLDQPSVSTDRTAATFLEVVTGTVVWVYLPTRGRYLLSLRPQSGFRKAGDVRGNTLRFTVDGDAITIASRTRIAPGSRAFNLYVKREPKWVPTYSHANPDALIVGTD
jgi:hypothetical protein